MNTKFEKSSRNAFGAVGIANPEQVLAKAQIVARIRAQKFTQVQAAKILGIPQPRVSVPLEKRLKTVQCKSSWLIRISFKKDILGRPKQSLSKSVSLI